MPVRRATAFAATSAVLAGLAHAVAGGPLPNPWLLLLGAALVGAAARAVAAGEATWPRIVVGLAAAQGFLHLWMATLGTHHHAGSAAAGSSARMLLAHVVATAAAAVWLRYAEQRLWQRARLAWVRSLIRPVQFEPPPRGERVPTAPISRPTLAESVFDAAASVVRGPPGVVRP